MAANYEGFLARFAKRIYSGILFSPRTPLCNIRKHKIDLTRLSIKAQNRNFKLFKKLIEVFRLLEGNKILRNNKVYEYKN